MWELYPFEVGDLVHVPTLVGTQRVPRVEKLEVGDEVEEQSGRQREQDWIK